MAIGVSIVLGLAALLYVLYPLILRTWRARRSEDIADTTGDAENKDNAAENTHTAQPETSPLVEREQAARAALHEIELDYQLGNISEDDYRTLRERYMHTALDALKSRYEREQEIDEEIEKRLYTMKDGHEQTER